MRITILAVGKMKEKYFADAVAEYARRLGRYCSLEIVEVADEKAPDGAGAREEEILLGREASRLKKHIKAGAYIAALAIDGEKISSEGFAGRLERLADGGTGHVIFIIGGSLGLDREILDVADWRLSFSDMTFPHRLMRVVLLEQIYRAYRIINHEPYHK